MIDEPLVFNRTILEVTRPNPRRWYHRLLAIGAGTYTEQSTNIRGANEASDYAMYYWQIDAQEEEINLDD